MAHAYEHSNYLLKEQIDYLRLCFLIKEMPQISQTMGRQRHWERTLSKDETNGAELLEIYNRKQFSKLPFMTYVSIGRCGKTKPYFVLFCGPYRIQ